MAEAASEFVVVLITVGSEGQAAALGRTLVEERLAACVNVLGAVRSIYRWEGQVQDEPEALMLVKTRREGFEALRQRVLALHEYSCPEIIALPLVAGHPPYLGWLAGAVGEPAK
jgi:periplasmic divalent cation tolerance protein